MVWKSAGFGALLLGAGIVVSAAPATAAGPCKEVLQKVCIGCHESDRFCGRLGGSEKEWRGLLKLMVANGAELEKDEVAPLAACLSGPAEEARQVCGR